MIGTDCQEAGKKFSVNYYFIFSVTLIVLIFSQVIGFEILEIDDADFIQRSLMHNLNDIPAFFSNKSPVYFRPLIEISFVLESKVWQGLPSGYHLTNFCLHIFNAIIIYLILLKFLKNSKNKYFYSSAGMLFFSLHPLTCESVAWISGRSDLLSTFFSLAAFYAYLSVNKIKYLLVPLFVFLGLLCKESAFSLIPIIILVDFCMVRGEKKNISKKLLNTAICMTSLSIPLATYIFIRIHNITNYNQKLIHKIIQVKGSSTISSFGFNDLMIFPSTIAFYLKKIIIPWPLNFAIYELNIKVYGLLFLLFVAFFIGLIYTKKYLVSLIILLTILAFAPALFIAAGNISWMPFAERYLYLSLCVWSIGTFIFVATYTEKNNQKKKIVYSLIVLIICIFSSTTFARLNVWKNNKTLFSDCYNKSSECGKIIYMYGNLLNTEEAQYYYQKSLKAKSNSLKHKAYIKIAWFQMDKGNRPGAIEAIERAIEIKPDYFIYHEAALIMKAMTSNDLEVKKQNLEKALGYFKLAYSKKKEPSVLFEIGKLNLKLNKKSDAISTFLKIIKGHPESKFVMPAKNCIARLEEGGDVSNALENE